MSWETLLLEDSPLLVRRRLAVEIGLNEAIALQQLHFTLTHIDSRAVVIEDTRWVQASLEYWSQQFPFWSEATIKRVFQSLRERALVATSRGREANVYTINYKALAHLAEEVTAQSDPSDSSTCAVGTAQSDPAPSIGEGTTERTTGGDDAAADGHLPGLAPPLPPPSPSDAKIQELWNHYSMIFGDRLKVKELTPPRMRALAKALKATNDDLDLCKRAMDGLKSYRIANPTGSKDIGLGVIFETGPQSRSNLTDQIEWWASQAGDQTTVPASVPSALRGRVLDLAVTVLKRELQPDSEAVAERAIQAEAQLSERFKLKVVSDGAGKLLRFEAAS